MLTLVCHAKLTYLNYQLEWNKKSSWGCACTLCYARKCSIVNFSEIADGQFALCLLDSRQFRRAEPISSRGGNAVNLSDRFLCHCTASFTGPTCNIGKQILHVIDTVNHLVFQLSGLSLNQ